MLIVVTNCPDRDTACAIAEALIAERIAAATNIGAPIDSVYRWNGEIVRGREIPLVLKTREEYWERAAARIREIHPYEVPGIWAAPATAVDPEYSAWIRRETREG